MRCHNLTVSQVVRKTANHNISVRKFIFIHWSVKLVLRTYSPRISLYYEKKLRWKNNVLFWLDLKETSTQRHWSPGVLNKSKQINEKNVVTPTLEHSNAIQGKQTIILFKQGIYKETVLYDVKIVTPILKCLSGLWGFYIFVIFGYVWEKL